MPRSSIYLGEKNESAIKAPYASINFYTAQHILGANSVTEYSVQQQNWGFYNI
jgi:hypothetical protein